MQLAAGNKPFDKELGFYVCIRRGSGATGKPPTYFPINMNDPDAFSIGVLSFSADSIFCGILCELFLVGLGTVLMQLVEVLVLFEGRILLSAGEQVNCDI